MSWMSCFCRPKMPTMLCYLLACFSCMFGCHLPAYESRPVCKLHQQTLLPLQTLRWETC